MHVGQTLRSLRISRDISLQNVSDALDIRWRSRVDKWERAEKPDVDAVASYLDALTALKPLQPVDARERAAIWAALGVPADDLAAGPGEAA